MKKEWVRTTFAILAMCIFVFAVVFLMQLAVGYAMLAMIGREKFSTPLWTAIYSAIVYVLAMVVIILLPLLLKRKWAERKTKDVKVTKKKEAKATPKKTTKKTAKEAVVKKQVVAEAEKLNRAELREELGLRDTPTWTDIGLAPVGFIVSLIIAAGLTAVFNAFPWFDANEAQTLGFSNYLAPGFDRIVGFFTLVVIAPIAEEIIFRGWLYGKIRERLNGKLADIWGIILSSLIVSVLFGIIHLQWNVGVTVFALSLVLCTLREITGTIYAGILTHMIKNGVAFYLIYVLGVV